MDSVYLIYEDGWFRVRFEIKRLVLPGRINSVVLSVVVSIINLKFEISLSCLTKTTARKEKEGRKDEMNETNKTYFPSFFQLFDGLT